MIMNTSAKHITLLVTGPIGSGKSEVCSYLSSKGVPVYDCDSRTKMLYSLVPGLKCDIECALGIRWEQIGIIFEDEAKRKTLESIVYPLLSEDIRSWKLNNASHSLLVIESALALGRSVFDGLWDKVLMVDAPYELRVQRNPKAAERSHLQKFDLQKVDYIIENDSDINELINKTEQLLCKLI